MQTKQILFYKIRKKFLKYLFVFLVALVATGMSAQQVKILPPSFAYQQVAKQQLQSAQKEGVIKNMKVIVK